MPIRIYSSSIVDQPDGRCASMPSIRFSHALLFCKERFTGGCKQPDLAAVAPHLRVPLPRLHPHAWHLRDHLAMSVLAHAAARSVAQILRAVHRAGHARAVQNTLPAHLAVEKIALGDLFTPNENTLPSTPPAQCVSVPDKRAAAPILRPRKSPPAGADGSSTTHCRAFVLDSAKEDIGTLPKPFSNCG